MKTLTRTWIGAGLLLAAGITWAQAPSTSTTPPPGAGPGASANPRVARHALRRQGGLAAQLNLTADQKAQAKTIFQQARADNQALASELMQARQELVAAQKNNAPQAQLDEMTAKVGNLTGQLAAARLKTQTRFYAILTPEQRAIVDARRGQMRQQQPPPQQQQQQQ